MDTIVCMFIDFVKDQYTFAGLEILTVAKSHLAEEQVDDSSFNSLLLITFQQFDTSIFISKMDFNSTLEMINRQITFEFQ